LVPQEGLSAVLVIRYKQQVCLSATVFTLN